MICSAEMEAAAKAGRRHGTLFSTIGIADWAVLVQHGHLGVAWGRAEAGGRFCPSPEGDDRLHVVVPVIEDGIIIDIAAFDPRYPRQWLLRLGIGSLLGKGAIEENLKSLGWSTIEHPLRLHSDPLSWLRNGRQGAALIQGIDHSIRHELRRLSSIEVANTTVANYVRRELSRTRIPQIAVWESD